MFDMFGEEQSNRRTESYSARGIDPTFEKVASAADAKELENKAYEEKRRFQQAQMTKEAECRLLQSNLIEKLANITNDESKMKAVLKLMVKEAGMKEEVKEVIKRSPYSVEQLEKVAAVPLEGDIYYEVKDTLRELSYVNDVIEKKAFLSLLGNAALTTAKGVAAVSKPIIKTVGWTGKNLAKGTYKTTKGVGGFMIKHPMLTMAGTTAAATGDHFQNIFERASLGYGV